MCKWKIGHRRTQVLCQIESIRAMTVSCRCEHLLQFDFNPNLADVGSSFFAWKESVMEQTLGALKIARLGQIEDQFEDQTGRRIREIRIFLENLHSFAGGFRQEAERLVRTEVNRDVRSVAPQSVPKSREGLLSVMLLVQQSQTQARIEDGNLRVRLAGQQPLFKGRVRQPAGEI